jgi:hypothetical protein
MCCLCVHELVCVVLPYREARPPAVTPSHTSDSSSSLSILTAFSQVLSETSGLSGLSLTAVLAPPSSGQSIFSSVEFDCKSQLVAAASVGQKILVYDYCAAMADPGKPGAGAVVELGSRAKLTCLSWNQAIQHQLLSSDSEGMVGG